MYYHLYLPMKLPLPVLLFLHTDSSHSLISLFSLKGCFFDIIISYKADLLKMNSVSVYLGMYLFHIHFWLTSFSFSVLNMSSYCFLDFIVSDEDSHPNEMLIWSWFLCTWWIIFLLLLSRFSFNSLTTICLGVNFLFILLGAC